MIKTIGCVECGEAVPYGRLSCPVCGALLASVAGARRTPFRVVEEGLEPNEAKESEPVSVATVVTALDAPPVTVAPAPAEVDVPLAKAVPLVMAVPQTAEAAFAVVVAPAAVDAPTDPAPEAPEALTASATSQVAATGQIQPLTTEAPTVETSSLAAQDTDEFVGTAPEVRWASFVEPPPMLTPRPYRRQFVFDRDEDVSTAPLSSAYRPPTLALSLATASAAAPSWPSSIPAAVAPRVATALDAGKAMSSIRGLVDAARFVEIAGWFVIVGATMSVLGFLLPWSRSVIGSSGIGSYFDAWGLASPTHSVVLLGLLAVLGLAIVPTRVPAWLRSGVVGLGLGGLLVGLTWPYLFGPLGADIGVTVTVLGGLALMIGGGVASWATRHAEVDLPV